MSMIVYHGSTVIVDIPEIQPVSRPLDFGIGFYTTTFKDRAEEWAAKKAKKENGIPIINVYDFDISDLHHLLTVKNFDSTSDEWLDFVLLHRNLTSYTISIESRTKKRLLSAKPGLHHAFDVVMGEVANDDVFDSIEFYEAGVISKDELIRRLKTKKINDQICFCSSDALKYLKFNSHYMKAGL